MENKETKNPEVIYEDDVDGDYMAMWAGSY